MKKIIFILICISQITWAKDLQIKNNIEGEGVGIINHSKIQVHYLGKLEDGTKFDSSYDRGEPLSFQIGLRQVIEGWERGLMGMKIGGKRTLIVPPELAYGERGAGDLIPPNATLIFDVEIIAIQPPGYKIISIDEFISMQKKDLIIIDIRTQEKWGKTGIIRSSKKINAFDQKGNLNPGFINSFKLLTKKNDLNSKVIFISSRGDISSILANGFVEKLGYKRMYSLKGGINEWITLGNPLLK